MLRYLKIHVYLVNILGQTIRHGHGLHEEPVVLVGRLGQTHLGGLLGDGLSEERKERYYM